MKTDIILKTLLFNAEGTILLLRRSESDIRRPLQWDLPGGVLDPGESLEQGAIREIAEESGLVVHEVNAFFAKTEIAEWTTDGGDTNTRNVLRMYFTANSQDSNVIISDEHSEFCWVSLEAAVELLEYPRHKEVIQWYIQNKLDI